jgi:thymidylate kinase
MPLLALYGINNIGKSTQVHFLVSRLKEAGYHAEYLKYPVYALDPTGKKLNEIIRGKKTLLERVRRNFFPGTKVARRQQADKLSQFFEHRIIRGEAKIVQKISEEELQMWYTLNRYQYQPELQKKLDLGHIIVAEDYTGTGLAWGSTKGADLKWLESMNRYLLKEDLGLLLDGKRFLRGREANHIHESNDPLVEKCRQSFLKLSKKYDWKIVNANQAVSEVSLEIWEIVRNFLQKKKEDSKLVNSKQKTQLSIYNDQ